MGSLPRTGRKTSPLSLVYDWCYDLMTPEVQAIGAGGEPHWIRKADSSIGDLLIAPLSGAEVILAASDDETMQVWSKSGDLLRRIEVGKRMERLLVADVDGDGAPEVLAKTPIRCFTW